MPVIDLGGWPKVHHNIPANRIIAIMTYPSDEAHRAELHHTLAVAFYNVAKDDHTAWTRQPEPTQVYALLGVRHHEASDTAVFQTARTAWQRGSVAGDVLLLIATLARQHGGGSVNKACHILAEAGKAGDRTSGLFPIVYTTPKSMRNEAWTPYRSVAHLWAAQNLMENFRVQQEPLNDLPLMSWVTNRDEFERFLGFAEALRAWGESYIPHGRQREGPTLLPQETWRVPDEIPLSEEYSVAPPPLPPRYHGYLATYKARA
jgi:hypothetical protein